MALYVCTYLATAVVFLGLDAIWLSNAGRLLYRPLLGDLLLDQFRMAPAVVFYLLYVVGIVIFAVQPAIVSGRWSSALLYGALFGFFAYGTYDLTNMATLRGWPVTITVVDLAWGTMLTAVSATAGYLIGGAVTRAMGG